MQQVDWSTEKNCFLTFAHECASFYSIQHDPFLSDSSQELMSGSECLHKNITWQWKIEHVLLPHLVSNFVPPNSLVQNGSILQIADLHELYKVFERC